MDIRDPSPENGYERRSPGGSPVDEYEYDYEQGGNEQRDEANYDVSVLDWSSPIDYEAMANESVRQETPLTSPMTSPTIPKIAEKGKGPYFCDLCNKTFTNYGSYRRHLRMHYCEKKYTCHLCGRQFFRRYLWVKHQEKIHGNDPSSCRCPHCGDWSQSPDALREHLRTQHKRTNGCKENWTKDQGSPCKSPLSPAVAALPVKKPRKKRTPKAATAATGVNKEKRRKKSTHTVEIKEELLSDTPVVVPEETREEEFNKQTPTESNFSLELKEAEDNEDSLGNAEMEDEGSGGGGGGRKGGDRLSPRNTSRYGRKRKQRVLFNTDMYPTSLKRFKRASLSSPGRRKSMDNSNSNGFIGDGEENRGPADNNDVSKAELSTPENQVLKEGEASRQEEAPVVESELSKLLQQALPNNNNTTTANSATSSNSNATMPKNVSHRGNFFCDKCRRFFINRSSYMRHKKMHTGVKPFTCEYCCMSFFRSESLTNHKKKHAKESFEEFRCYLCGYKAANCASLRNHFHTVCSREKPEENSKRSHWVPAQPNELGDAKDEEGSSRNIAGYCSLCNRAFFNLSNYQRHAKLHSNMATTVPMELTYNCSFCGKIFTNRAQYDGHVLAHSKEDNTDDNLVTENGIPTSLEVLKLFGNFVDKHGNSGLDDEARIKEEPVDPESLEFGGQDNNNPRVMCCRLCPLAFTDRKTFLQHQKSHKRGESPYSCYCRYCGHPQKDKNEVASHESACYETRSAENRLHHCYNCDVKFDNGSALREHVKAAHSNDREELARRNSTDSLNSDKNEEDAMESTLKFVESDDKNAGKYKCGKCSDTFNDIQSVVSHIQKGHGEVGGLKDDDRRKNWEMNGESGTSIMKQLLSSPPASMANYANKSAVVSATNKNRSRSFTCSLCLKAFDDPRVAEAHEQQAHVMVDWFQCALCEKTGGKKAMLKHMASHMLKIGSVVTTLGDQDQDSDADTLDLGKVSFPDRSSGNRRTYGGRNNRVPPHPPVNRDNQPPQFVSMFCQLCKKVISSLATLERHRHASQDPNVSYPYICCMPGCGKCFALKVEAVAHLQTLHKGSLTPSLSSVAQPKAGSPRNANGNQDNQRNRWLLGNSWKGLVAGGVGPFSQSLVQLSMAVAGKDPEASRGAKTATAGKRDEHLIDIYQSNALENLTSNGELTITKVTDVEEITVEPLLECVLEEDIENNATEDGAAEEPMVMALSPGIVHEDLEEGEIPDGETPSPLKDQLRVNNKVLLQCEDCQSVFTNPCSWKRHRKLHLGIMKHKCTFCPRKFYRKDHCDKHVKTHENCSVPRRRKSPINIKVEPTAAVTASAL